MNQFRTLILFAVGLITSLIVPLSSFAQSMDPAPSLHPENTFDMSKEDSYYDLREPGEYKKNGGFYGLKLADTYRPESADNWWINTYHADVDGDWGLMNYDFEPGRVKSVQNYKVEPSVWVGRILI